MEGIKTLIEQKKASIQASNTKATTTEPMQEQPNLGKPAEPKVKVTCELCGKDFEVEEWEFSYRKPTAHPECEEKVRLYKSIGIDKLFWNLPKFIVEPGNQDAYKAATEFIANPTRGLFFFGKAGTGKTHLVAKIAQETKLQTKFVKMAKLLLELRSNFGGDSWENEKIIEKLSKVELLIIDDLGAEKMSDWVAETLYLLIDERYGNMKPTIITSNFSLEELEERIGDRICSRIMAMCRLVRVNTNDYRAKSIINDRTGREVTSKNE